MKLPPILAAAILAATVAQVRGQDDLDSLSKSLKATPAPAASTPKPALATTPAPTASISRAPVPTAAATPQPRAATAPRPTAPATPREEKPDLSHARFVQEDDLAGLAGKKVSNTYLVGTFKANGEKAGARTVFTTRSVIPILGVVRGNTRILVRYLKPVDPRTVAEGNSCQWVKESPLKVERVEGGSGGVTVYATDLP